jgi:virginiamycin B lyase
MVTMRPTSSKKTTRTSAASSVRTRAAAALAVAFSLAFWLVGNAGATTVGQITELATPSSSSEPEGIAAGPDGNLWFAEGTADKIADVNPVTHAITEYPLPTLGAVPLGVAVGPDGNIWFTEFGAGKIGELDPATGAISEFALPTANSGPVDLVAGSTGNVWFTESLTGKIGEIDVSTHEIIEYSTPTAASGPFGITVGPDGNIWFTEKSAGKIGKLIPATGTITEYPLAAGSQPNGITVGPNGSLWFTEAGSATIVEFSPPGFATPISTTVGSGPLVVVTGPDGNIWFTAGADSIGEIDPVTHQLMNTFTTPTGVSNPVGLAAGADGNLWFTESSVSNVGVLESGIGSASATLPQITGTPAPGATLTCAGATWATWNDLQPSLGANGFDGYAWLANGAAISGATAQTYVPVAGNVGEQLTCRVAATYALPDTTGVATSAPVTIGSPPVNSGEPSISGAAVAGKTLTENHGSWSGVPTAFGYQWELCNAAGAGCATIAGATGQTYTIPAADAGQSLRVLETAANPYGTGGPATSAADVVAALPSAALAKVASTGPSLSAWIDCAGAAGQSCAGSYTVTTTERLRGTSVVAVTAAATTKPNAKTKTKTKTKTITIARGSYKVRSAATTRVAITVDATAKKLLAQFYKVAASLTVSGTPTTDKAITLRYTRVNAVVAATWAAGPVSSTVAALTVSRVPAKGVIDAICHGGGCPFPKRQFNAKRGAASLTQGFSTSHLAPGATLEIEISAPDHVAKVVEFTIMRSRQPALRELCLAPGDRQPTRCV